MSRHRKLLINLLLSLSLISITGLIGTAQSEPTATPFSPIIPQGQPNVGRPEPFAVSDIAIRTGLSPWQSSGYSGQSIRVGVLDRGFGNLAAFEEDVDTSVAIASGGNTETYSANETTHGTQVLETIHAIAPDANLYACEYNDLDSFDLCITWMIRSDVNIVNHSAGVPVLPLDGTNAWAQQVDRAAREGILWVNAAGNFAEGYFTDRFTDTQPNKLHEFRAVGPENNEALGVRTTEQAGRGVVMLSWSNYGDQQATEIDLDLQIIDAETGEVIIGSYEEQAGFPTDQAMEYVSFSPERPYAVQVIDNTSEASGVEFVLFVAFAQLPTVRSQGSVIAPGDSPNSLTVGALQGIRLAPYSSRGQLENGQIGVDLVAPGEVKLRDGTDFIGTSAAAAVVSGSAALIWQSNPEFDADDVRTYLENAAIDDAEFPGRDNNYGYGRLDVPPPAEGVEVAQQPTNTPRPQPTATSTQRPEPTATERPTNTPRPQPTATPEPGSDDATITINVESANLRDGPGTNYTAIDSARSGEQFDVVAKSDDWYLIDVGSGSRAWVWSGIVNLRGDESQIAIVLTVPAPPPTLSPVSQPNNNSQLSSSENENLNCDTSFSRLNIGSLAEVTGPSSIAVISSSGEVIDYAPIGAVVRVLSGPRCTSLYRPNNPNGSTDGIGIQWEVQIGSSVVGYVIEYNLFGNDLTYTLQPK